MFICSFCAFCILLLLHVFSNFQVFKVLLLLQKYLKTPVHEKMNASSYLVQLSLKKRRNFENFFVMERTVLKNLSRYISTTKWGLIFFLTSPAVARYFWWLFVLFKGQTKSKWFFQADFSSKKTNEWIRLYYYDTSGRLFFEDTKKTFRN